MGATSFDPYLAKAIELGLEDMIVTKGDEIDTSRPLTKTQAVQMTQTLIDANSDLELSDFDFSTLKKFAPTSPATR